jgi:hypothetical protein
VIRNHCKKSVYSYTLKFQEFPEDELLHCPSKDAVESQFMSMLKEADSLKHKSQVINSMQKKDHKQIWTALIHGIYLLLWSVQKKNRKNLGHHGRDRMVVGFTTTYAISAYHHWCCDFESQSGRAGLYITIFFYLSLRTTN